MSHGSSVYERKVCTKQLYTKDNGDRPGDGRVKRVLMQIGTRIKTEPSAETTNSLAKNIRLGYRRLPGSSRPT